jgi:transposase
MVIRAPHRRPAPPGHTRRLPAPVARRSWRFSARLAAGPHPTRRLHEAIVPPERPSPARGAALFHDDCTGCQGIAVAGDGADVARLGITPANFTDCAFMHGETPRDASNAITLGPPKNGMPHPVYIPTGEIRALRALLSRRRLLQAEYNRWRYRARAYLRAAGCPAARGAVALRTAVARAGRSREASVPLLGEARALCARQEVALRRERQHLDAQLAARTRTIESIARLTTLPGVGVRVAATLYAWVGDVRRFPNAKALAAAAGLVPSVRQSGGAAHDGEITQQGAKALRATLVQAAHVLLSRCRGAEAVPLQAIGIRIRTSRGRRTIAMVAVARHLLRVAYYLLRDGTTCDPQRVHGEDRATAPAA